MQATKPFKKSEAFDLIKAMRNGKSPTELELDRLYLYFAPVATKGNITGEQWVTKAVAKNDLRVYLKYVYVESGVMYGSDGHRVHWIDTDKPDGFYCPKTLEKVELDLKYPNMKRVISNEWCGEGIEYEQVNNMPVKDTSDKETVWRYDFFHNDTGPSIQKTYMDSALFRKLPYRFTAKNDGRGVYGEYSDGAKFIILGMRL